MANIQVLDKLYDENIKIWRYMDFWKLKRLVNQRELYFSALNRLQEEDELEGIPSKPMEKILKDLYSEYSRKLSLATVPPTQIKIDHKKEHQNHADLVYVNCWSIDDSESTWMWNNYTKSTESIVIQSTRKRLEHSFINDNDLIFISSIEYINHEDFIRSPSHGLDAFVRKNEKFKKENELRVIFDYLFYKKGVRCNGIPISVDIYTLIEQVNCHPNSSDDFVKKVIDLINNNSLNVKVKKSEISL